jgi:N-acyl-D-aspartate/D-glutamate deacylase
VTEIIPQFRAPAFRARVAANTEFRQYIDEHGGWEGIVASRVLAPTLKHIEGRTVAQIAVMRGADPLQTCFDLVAEEGAFPFGVYHNMSEDDVKTVMRQPWVSIASDGSAINLDAPGKPHPRAYGTNVRVLGKYVREENVLSLEEAIRKMTSLPAQVLGLSDRGLLRVGSWADVVAFDPNTVRDMGTFDNPQQYAEGVPYVLVNGVVVIDKGQHNGERPGQVVYNPRKQR